MRRTPLVVLTFVIMAFGISAVAAASPNRVHITFITPTVSPGGVIDIQATVAPRTLNCAAILRGPSATELRLPAHRSTIGRLQWRYRIPVNTHAGNWSAVVSCGLSGHASKEFNIASPLPAANVIESSDGFTQSSDLGSVSYGVVLQNKSTVGDALGVTVTVRFLDSLGRSLTSDQTTTLSGIPADSNFYLGGFAYSNVSLNVVSMQVMISTTSTQTHSLILPPSSVSLQTNSVGNESAIGTVTDPYQTAMSNGPTIYVVYFGPQGNVVGGDSEFIGNSIQPGESAAVDLSDIASNFYSIQPPSGATVKSSVDPCGVFGLGSCPSGQ